MPVPSPRGDGEKVRRQPRMRGAFVLFCNRDEVARAHCCNVDHSPPPTAPHPVLPHHLLPAARGEGTAIAVARMQAAFPRKRMLVPSPRGDGEKVRRQPRMRGAFVLHLCSSNESALAHGCNVDRTHLPRPLIRCCRTTFSPLARGEGKLALSQECKLRFRENASYPFSPLRGAKGPGCVSRDCCDLAQKAVQQSKPYEGEAARGASVEPGLPG